MTKKRFWEIIEQSRRLMYDEAPDSCVLQVFGLSASPAVVYRDCAPRAHRNPSSQLLIVGVVLLRIAERMYQWPLWKAPPRCTRRVPCSGPRGFRSAALPYGPYQSHTHSLTLPWMLKSPQGLGLLPFTGWIL